MWRNLASNFLTILIVALVAVAVAIGWGQRQYVATGPLEEAICIEVPRGGSMSRVADNLYERGAISNATIYRLGADYADKSDDLKAGSFLIQPGASMEEIVAEITGDGRSTCGTQIVYIIGVGGQEARVRELDPETQEFEVTAEFDPAEGEFPDVYLAAKEEVGTEFLVTVVEGVTSWQVVEGLKASDLFTGEIAEVPAEGSLAPDGYEIRPGADRAAFLANMAAIQSERLATAWENRSPDTPVSTPEEAMILASIIEKETAIPEERGLVASVFANRLRQGIRLQTDPTVIYGVTEGKGVLGRGLRQSELRAETPWNTYVIDGLPPTPIANPGLASIRAALNPEASDYVYFVAKTLDPKDGHNFAVTLDEHNANVAAYRALERAAE
ncbi:MAG: endolytic transglycosylase MltG [Roseovarius confluentis]|uniref:endolytic transglycosylase MltG n=1 Tax=Roseovarius sp. TaxID=1486281 RepID=UPI0032EE07F4